MLTKKQYDHFVDKAKKHEDDLMDAIREALTRKYQEAMRPLPNYQDVIRQEYVQAFKPFNERPILDLENLCN